MRIHIIWPEDRWVDETQIHSWYRDAHADGKIADMPAEVDTIAAVYALNDIGFITSTDEVEVGPMRDVDAHMDHLAEKVAESMERNPCGVFSDYEGCDSGTDTTPGQEYCDWCHDPVARCTCDGGTGDNYITTMDHGGVGQVGCENDDGTLTVHGINESCNVCRHLVGLNK